MASVEDLIAAVKTQITALEEAKALVSRGQAALSGAHQAMTGISRGSTNYKLTVTLEALSAAIGAAQQAETAGTSAVEQFTTYLTAIGAPVAWTANSTVHPAVRKVPEADPTVRDSTPRTPDGKTDLVALAKRLGLARKEFFDAAVPQDVVDVVLGKLPKKERSNDGVKTYGVWIDSNGRQREVRSGRGEKVRGGSEYLDLDYQKAVQYWRVLVRDHKNAGLLDAERFWNLSTNEHAEIKAAVEQRATGMKHGNVIINNPEGPCDGAWTACKNLLKRYIRRGSTLAIYWPNGGHMIINGDDRAPD